MSEAQSKNAVSNGAKIKLPIGESADIGRPHAIRMGSDIRVRNNCTIINRTIFSLKDDAMLIIFIVIKIRYFSGIVLYLPA